MNAKAVNLRGGVRTAPKPLDPNKLFWIGNMRPLVKRIGLKSLIETEQGGLRIKDSIVAANLMTEIFTEKVSAADGLWTPQFRPEVVPKTRSDIKAFEGSLTQRQFQRLVDAQSSYDLFTLNRLVTDWLKAQGFRITVDDLFDPAMKKLQNLPGCFVTQCSYGPTFDLRTAESEDVLIYDAGKLLGGEYVFDRRKDQFRTAEDGGVEINLGGRGWQKAVLPWVMPWLFSQAGLSGISMHMTDFNPLTALGGMGMSNLLVGTSLQYLHFLANSGIDVGTLHSQGGFIEKFRFARETGFQEWQQMSGGGHVVLKNAPGIFGGIARRLNLASLHDDIQANMHLVLINRPVKNVTRAPINDTWCLQAQHPAFEQTYIHQFLVTQGEVSPFIDAANGRPLSYIDLAGAYNRHNEIRYRCCWAYRGNEEQAKFYAKVLALGGALMPLGEGGEKAACALFLSPDKLAELGLTELTAAEAARTDDGTITGIIPYKLESSTTVWGTGFNALASSGDYSFPRPALEIAQYE